MEIVLANVGRADRVFRAVNTHKSFTVCERSQRLLPQEAPKLAAILCQCLPNF